MTPLKTPFEDDESPGVCGLLGLYFERVKVGLGQGAWE